MLIDFHVPLYDQPGYGEALAETARSMGLHRLCIMGGQSCYGLAANAEVRRLADAYPELFSPFAHITLGHDDARTVERMARVGFAGLHVSAPPASYDDPSFMPVYEAAAALDMPVLFHTGYLPVTRLDRARRVRSANMRPVYLDTVARFVPELKIVGIGLGSPWCGEAAETLRHNRNVCFDLSGEVLRRRGADFLAEVFRPAQAALWDEEVTGSLWEQVVFGSGVHHEEIVAVERDYQRIFRSLGVSREEIDAVMGLTAARLLGIPAED